ncbi:hypothetical protein [Kushneria sp. EE4]
MPSLRLTARSLHKTSPSQRLQAWDLDLQPGKKPMRFESHYQDFLELEDLAQQLQAWVELDEADLNSLEALANIGEPATLKFLKDDFEPSSLSKQGSSPNRHIRELHGRLRKQLPKALELLEHYPNPIRLVGFPSLVRIEQPSENNKKEERPFGYTLNMVEIIQTIRAHCQSRAFLKNQFNAQRADRKAHSKRIEWVNNLFQEHASLHVVHLVLISSYLAGFHDSAFSTLQEQRKELIDNLKKRKGAVCTGMVGYSWKIFHHPWKGLRLSLVLLFDPDYGEKSSEDITNAVAQYWINSITRKKGLALTRSLLRERQAQSSDGILAVSSASQVGKVHRDNAEQMGRLQSLMNYLATLDHFGGYAPWDKEGKKRQQPRCQGQGRGPWYKKGKAQPNNTGE